MTDARLVSFSSVMNSLPVGGMTMRMACGTITRRRIWRRVIPRARPITIAAASETIVNPRARSAPFQYGSEVSASQKRWVWKLATTRGGPLLHVRGGQLVLRGEPRQRAVRPQRRHGRAQCCAEL